MIEMFPTVVSKTKEENVIHALTSCVTYIAFFHLWMFCARHNTFAMVVSFISDVWEPIMLLWVF
jgi:hypothetical protein